jgi:hypothetical protein
MRGLFRQSEKLKNFKQGSYMIRFAFLKGSAVLTLCFCARCSPNKVKKWGYWKWEWR